MRESLSDRLRACKANWPCSSSLRQFLSVRRRTPKLVFRRGSLDLIADAVPRARVVEQRVAWRAGRCHNGEGKRLWYQGCRAQGQHVAVSLHMQDMLKGAKELAGEQYACA